MSAPAPLAVLSALPEEQQGLFEQMTGTRTVHYAGRDFHCGSLHGQPVVLALSRIGKVAASITAAALIEHFGADRVVFTGVAGGVGYGVQVGDVVIGSGFVQHDMDASPLFPKYEVPLSGQTIFPGDAVLTAQLLQACRASQVDGALAKHRGSLHYGLIASGDRFVNGVAEAAALVQALQYAGHAPLAVEMEGAAVAQVCCDHGVAFAAVRTISDRADDTAYVDFSRFVRDIAGVYAQEIIARFLRLL